MGTQSLSSGAESLENRHRTPAVVAAHTASDICQTTWPGWPCGWYINTMEYEV